MKIQQTYKINNCKYNNTVSKKSIFFGLKSDKLEKSLDDASSLNELFAKQTTIIPPKTFMLKSFKDYEPTIKRKENHTLQFIEKINGYQQIKKEYNPAYLEIINKKTRAYRISNFDYPYGSIAISTPLKEKISTEKLIYCAGIVFVDKKHNLQTLLHFCPTISKKENDELLQYILSFSNPKDLDITIIPGSFPDTEYSVDYLYNKINETIKGAKISFVNFPDEKNTALILSNGKLYCTNCQNISGPINPIDRISAASLDPDVQYLR